MPDGLSHAREGDQTPCNLRPAPPWRQVATSGRRCGDALLTITSLLPSKRKASRQLDRHNVPVLA